MKDTKQDMQLFVYIFSLIFAPAQWCETQRDCNRLRLVDILVRPMQRLTKYSLLLKAILKNTEDLNQRRDLLEMVSLVRQSLAIC